MTRGRDPSGVPPELLAELRLALRAPTNTWIVGFIERARRDADMSRKEAAARLRLLAKSLRALEDREENGWCGGDVCPNGGQGFFFETDHAIRAGDLSPIRDEIEKIARALVRPRRRGAPGKALGYDLARMLAGNAVGFGLKLFRNDADDASVSPSACDLAAETLEDAAKQIRNTPLPPAYRLTPEDAATLDARQLAELTAFRRECFESNPVRQIAMRLADELPTSYDAVRRAVDKGGRATSIYVFAFGPGAEDRACWQKKRDSRQSHGRPDPGIVALSETEWDGAKKMDRYLTMRELSERLGGRSRSAIYGDLVAGRLPQPLRLGGRVYWRESDQAAHLRGLAADKRDACLKGAA